MTDRELLEQALLCLEGWENTLDEDCGEPDCDECKPFRRTREAITALRERLEQPDTKVNFGAIPKQISEPEQETVMAEYKFQTYAAYQTDGEMKIGVVPEPEPPCKTGASCVGGKCPQCEAQPEQGPVGEIVQAFADLTAVSIPVMPPVGTKLYTTPPRCPNCASLEAQNTELDAKLAGREWQGLTEEEIERTCAPLGAAMLSFTEVARAIEAKLREKNA